MHLYLIQHAEAKSEAEDPERGLSERGLGDVHRVATYASHHVANIDKILHSDKKRAVQTAQHLAEHLYPTHGIEYAQGLSPLDDPAIIANQLKTMTHDTAVVGHLPHLSKLASMLLGNEQLKEVISFRMGCIVCLEKYDEEPTPEALYGRWAVRWMLVPEIIG
ncbi:MAG: phosphohistidine phosphatase SixA [Deltaproteobacteria bacterium RIFCSPLOWO2_02_FULL_53_8]|nr:MAG: phosphohistidine phosphatase SixA [Deltaproteobacteria bacterium RIFCSPLOWO2_02_FULL_53_8]